MIRTFLHLDVKPGHRDALIDWYKDSRSLERAVAEAGCLSTELYPDAADENRLLVTALWETPADYENWVNNPSRQSSTGDINRYLAQGFTPATKGTVVESIHHAKRI